MKVYIVITGNYALSINMNVFSTKELAEGFKQHLRNERKTEDVINILEMEIDKAVLKEEDM